MSNRGLFILRFGADTSLWVARKWENVLESGWLSWQYKFVMAIYMRQFVLEKWIISVVRNGPRAIHSFQYHMIIGIQSEMDKAI